MVKTRRYVKIYDCPDSTTCDVCYVDVTTGKEVMRYDGADPANTREDYGAKSDEDCFIEKGLALREMIDSAKAVDPQTYVGRYTEVEYFDFD